MKNIITVLSSLTKQGYYVTIASHNEDIAEISISKNGRTMSDMAVLTNRKLPIALQYLANRFEDTQTMPSDAAARKSVGLAEKSAFDTE